MMLLCCISLTGVAQSRIFFSVSAVDRVSNINNIGSYPTSLNKSTTCLQVQSGLLAFYGIEGTSLFNLDCATLNPSNNPEIRLFPNPVVNYTRIQSTTLLTANPTLQLWITDAAGRVVLRRSVSNAQLYAGTSLFLGMLSSGNYFLKIEGPSIQQVIQFIKVN